MHAPHSIAEHARSLARPTAVALAALTLTLVVGASSAQAGVSDPTLTASQDAITLSTIPWWRGGGSCLASGNATWDRANNLLIVNGVATSTAPFYGCWARLRVTFWGQDDSGQEYDLGEATADIPTACGVQDPSCHEEAYLENKAIPDAIPGDVFGMPRAKQVDHITVSLEAR